MTARDAVGLIDASDTQQVGVGATCDEGWQDRQIELRDRRRARECCLPRDLAACVLWRALAVCGAVLRVSRRGVGSVIR